MKNTKIAEWNRNLWLHLYIHDHKKMIPLMMIILIIVTSVMIHLIQIQNAKKIISTIENRDYETLDELCKTPLSGINTTPVFSKLIHVVLDMRPKFNPLETAVDQNDTEAVRILLEHHAKPDACSDLSVSTYKTYPLSRAIAKGNVSVVKMLIEAGANVEASANVGLHSFVVDRQWHGCEPYPMDNFIDILTLLEQNGADIDRESLLISAAVGADIDVLAYLTEEKGWSAHLNQNDGKTLLHVCCARYKGSKEDPALRQSFAQYCLKLGIDPQIKDTNGKTAYDYAVEDGFAELAELVKP